MICNAPATASPQFRLHKGNALTWALYSPAGSADLRFYDTADRVTIQAGTGAILCVAPGVSTKIADSSGCYYA